MRPNQRILFLARHLDGSGVPTHMMALARGLIERGYTIALATSGRTGIHEHGPEWFEEFGVRHFRIPFPGPALNGTNLLSAVRALGVMRKVLRDFRPDLIHVHYRATSPYALVGRLYGVPFITTLHLDQIPASGIYRFGSFWGKRSIAISRETKSYLIESFGVKPERIRVVYNGVDETYFRPPTPDEKIEARTRLGLRPDERVVCLIGRLEPVKGHDVLIDALAFLRKQGSDLVALCAGEGDQKDTVCGRANQAGVADMLRFLGYLDTRQVLWASDVLVLPSKVEGFGLVVVEAMMCGVVPIRTPAAGAYDQIEPGINGYIMPFGDHVALARQLQALLDDEVLRGRMAANALATARSKFTARQMVEDTIRVYEEVIS